MFESLESLCREQDKIKVVDVEPKKIAPPSMAVLSKRIFEMDVDYGHLPRLLSDTLANDMISYQRYQNIGAAKPYNPTEAPLQTMLTELDQGTVDIQRQLTQLTNLLARKTAK